MCIWHSYRVFSIFLLGLLGNDGINTGGALVLLSKDDVSDANSGTHKMAISSSCGWWGFVILPIRFCEVVSQPMRGTSQK